MAVFGSRQPLVSLPTAASRPALTSSPRFLPAVSCSSKRKKKASAKPKVLSSAKPTKPDFLQDEDFLPGGGGGASTFTALQPLVDEEDNPLHLDHRLQLQLAQQSLVHMPPSNPSAEQITDPLERFTLAAYEPSNAPILSLDGLNDSQDADTDSSDYDSPAVLDDTAYELSNDDDDEEEESEGPLDDEYEWIEVNADDDDDGDVEGDDRFVYWEGDLPPMSKEEEAKVLHQARRDLEWLEKKKKHVVSKFNLLKGVDNEEDGDEEDGHLTSEESEICEDDKAFLEADMALSQFEANAKKTLVTKKYKSAVSESRQKTKLHDGSMQWENDHGDVPGSGEGDTSFVSRKDLKTGRRIQKNLGEEEEFEEKQMPKKGVPAVMRSFDKAKIYVKAGNGGNGVVAFRREKYVPFGGPSGGSGGRGGHVYLRADPSLNSLLCFRRSVHFRAGRGSHGMGKSQDGAAGTDCFIDVPLGTAVRKAGDGISGPGKVLLELTRPNQCELLLLGGRGGRGNAAFKTGRNKAPQIAENGEEGAEMWLELELKLVADVGIIGVPNAGKSTLLSVISAAQPAIGAYPFTTLLPNLGVVRVGFESTMVVADLPGLLEGAHLGIGLGHEFLRHTERCQVLVHVIDGMSQQPEHEYEAVRLELQLFNPSLSEKPSVVAYNKMDIPEGAERWPNFRDFLKQKGIEPICISAATKTGVSDVVNKAFSLLQSLPNSSEDTEEESQSSDELGVAEMIRRQRSAPIGEFEILGNKDSKYWEVQGVGLERFIQMTNWEYFEALTRFQHVLAASGVNKALKERGVAEGDIVIVGEMEFVWHDSEDITTADWKRGFRGSRKWPH